EYFEHIDMSKKYMSRASSCYQVALSHKKAAKLILDTEIDMAVSSFSMRKQSKNSGFDIPWNYQNPFQQGKNQEMINTEAETMGANEQISLSTYIEITKHVVLPICCIGGGIALLVCGIILSTPFYSIAGTCGSIIGIAHLIGFRERGL
ncbi:unnamed protein product, partial [marine sediment metagenome]